jgi:hypothetical protein
MESRRIDAPRRDGEEKVTNQREYGAQREEKSNVIFRPMKSR